MDSSLKVRFWEACIISNSDITSSLHPKRFSDEIFLDFESITITRNQILQLVQKEVDFFLLQFISELTNFFIQKVKIMCVLFASYYFRIFKTINQNNHFCFPKKTSYDNYLSNRCNQLYLFHPSGATTAVSFQA